MSLERALRHRLYAELAAGRPAPRADDLAAWAGASVDEVRAALARLHDDHALVSGERVTRWR